MKKIIRFAMLMPILFLLSGCSPKPESTLNAYLSALKNKDSSELGSLYQEEYFDGSVSLSADLSTESQDSATPDAFSKRYTELFQGFEYKIGSTEIDGDKATVELTVTTYPLGEIMTNYFREMFTNAFAWGFSGLSQEEISQKMADLFVSQTADAQKTYVSTVSVNMTKGKDQWLIAGGDRNLDLFNAITGGVLVVAKNMNQTEPNTQEVVNAPIYQLGEQIGFTNGLRFTALETREDFGKDFSKPTDGNVFFYVKAQLENASSVQVTSSTMMQYELKDSEGLKYNTSWFANTKGSLDGSIVAGDLLTGEIAFEIPKDFKGELFLYFSPDAMANKVKIKVR